MTFLRHLIQLLDKVDRKLSEAFRRGSQQPWRAISVADLSGETVDFIAPCFVLSTGRCGTLWLSELLRFSSLVYVNHSDSPELVRHSRMAYDDYNQNPRLFREIIRATRDESLLYAYRRHQMYVETNNRITFFAYAIKQVYPRARFIHLIRHPGDFVRSGLSRGWYHGHHHDLGRIVMDDQEAWRLLSDIEKIAWLWNETNRYIETFADGLSGEDYLQVKSEVMFSDAATAIKLCDFLGVKDIPEQLIAKQLTKQINQQKVWRAEPYAAWSAAQKDQIRRHAVLAARYAYEL